MRKLLFNATSSLLIMGLILTGCGSNNQGDSAINSSATASVESTPEIIDDTELTDIRGVFDSDDDSFKVDIVQIKGINRATSIPADFSETLIVQEENNIRKIRSGLGYYMELKISTSISGGTVTYAYHLKDDLSLGQIDAMRTQLEEKYDESIGILQSALEPQIAFRMPDPVVSVEFRTKAGEVFYSQDSKFPGDAPIKEDVPIQGDAPVKEEIPPQSDTTSAKSTYMNSIQYAEELISDAPSASSYTEGLQKADEAWDKELNRIYGLLRKKLSSQKMDSLKKDELAWIKSRDKEVGDPEVVGVWTALEVRIQLTKERTLYLIDMYFDEKVNDHVTKQPPIKVYVKGTLITTFPSPPITKNGILLVPFDPMYNVIVEPDKKDEYFDMNEQIIYDESTKTIRVEYGDMYYKLIIGDKHLESNYEMPTFATAPKVIKDQSYGEIYRYTLAAAPEIINNKVYVSLRTIANIYGYKFSWDSGTSTAKLK